MHARSEEIRKELQREAKDAVNDAMRALENGQSTDYAQSRLKEIGNRLRLLEDEYRGGCSW